jgi:flavin-dependent dehydrogenase
VFDRALTDYYSWTIPKGDSTIIGGAFPMGSDARHRFDALVARLRAEGFRFGAQRGRMAAQVARPSRPGDVVVGRSGCALIGEAAGLISPSSAEGISYALRSGAALAFALEDGVDGALSRYHQASLPLRLEVIAKMAKARAIHGPLARRLIMHSGIGSIPRAGLDSFGGFVTELLAP